MSYGVYYIGHVDQDTEHSIDATINSILFLHLLIHIIYRCGATYNLHSSSNGLVLRRMGIARGGKF